MTKIAVVGVGGKQYLVSPGDEIIVTKVAGNATEKIELPVLMMSESDGTTFEMGAPTLKKAIGAEIVDQTKADKIHIARFKAKVRFRKLKGFREHVTKLKIAEF